MSDALDRLELHLLNELSALSSPAIGPTARSNNSEDASAMWRAQVQSRHCDFAARWLQKRGRSFYTIGSAGHESNSAVALASRHTDPALLHYRSGAFYLARAAQYGHDGVRDILLGVASAIDEPIAGGRHKVFGHPDLAVIPQTSTIASHLPRAVGVAFALERARKLGLASRWPSDSIVICSFGDASLNHATAQAAINAAGHADYQGLPVPLLFVCEDNGLGISVPTPAGWVESSLRCREQLRYQRVDGDDSEATLQRARELVEWVRKSRRPGILHIRTVRFLSHAGADVESAYRSAVAIRADWQRDPLLGSARWLVSTGERTGPELATEYMALRARVRACAEQVAERPQLESAEEVMAPLAPRSPSHVSAMVGSLPWPKAEPLTLAQSINFALADVLNRHPEAIVFGEDVAVKGGVYGVTRGLRQRFGAGRVFDTLLDETSLLGLALGSALTGFTPLPEIQYLAYLHNAEDQIRGEAATLQFFSQGQYRNGMVIRIAGYGYQKGFGGHFHNDNALGVLRDIPGLVIASPAAPDDAAAMLRACVAAAVIDGSVCVFLEPIALYHARDLYEDGDGLWLARPESNFVPLGSARTYGDGRDLTILSWANGLRMSLRVAKRLEDRGIATRVVDLRWLAPLPMADILRESRQTGRVLIVDETRRTGGVSEGIVTALVDNGFEGHLARVTSKDSFVPLGDAASTVLLSEAEITTAAIALARAVTSA